MHTMRINKFIAHSTGLSRRKADDLVNTQQVCINGIVATNGDSVSESDTVTLNKRRLSLPNVHVTILLNKPTGYVCSRNGQGSKTIYDILPKKFHHLKPIGRLDKNSSGLLLLTTDGVLSQKLSHPSYQKTKVYEVCLDKPLSILHWEEIHEQGIMLTDGLSKLFLERLEPFNDKNWQVTMREGRNRQIRRTFAALGYEVIKLHRTQFGNYKLDKLNIGEVLILPKA